MTKTICRSNDNAIGFIVDRQFHHPLWYLALSSRKVPCKMNEISRTEGRTVSHSRAAIRSLCTHGLVLRNDTRDVVSAPESYVTDRQILANARQRGS
jgi:hypothetical protein